eukprot:9249720-Heterocapsa_arctica.AAC.1
MKSKDIGQRGNPRGINSFIASAPKEEYKMDRCFFPASEAPVNKRTALLMVDMLQFTKYMEVVVCASKEVPDVLAGIMEAIKKMGGNLKPSTPIKRALGPLRISKGGSRRKGSDF